MKNKERILSKSSLTILFILHSLSLFSQTQIFPSEFIEFIPHGWTFPPLIAQTIEPRVGFLAHFNDNNLRLDIGNSIDIFRVKISNDSTERLTTGADFFTWTALRGEENFHFPVEAVDYLFGLNFSYQKKNESNTLSSRLRISHISAHLVDGNYDKSNSSWRNNRFPRIYSREFIDVIFAIEQNWFRIYGAVQYLFHVDPPELAKWSYQFGTEIVKLNLFDLPVHSYLAYDLRFVSISKYAAVHSTQAGIKVGYWRGRGLNIFIAAYNGMSYHGEYYDIPQSYWGPGITIDF